MIRVESERNQLQEETANGNKRIFELTVSIKDEAKRLEVELKQVRQ